MLNGMMLNRMMLNEMMFNIWDPHIYNFILPVIKLWAKNAKCNTSTLLLEVGCEVRATVGYHTPDSIVQACPTCSTRLETHQNK